VAVAAAAAGHVMHTWSQPSGTHAFENSHAGLQLQLRPQAGAVITAHATGTSGAPHMLQQGGAAPHL
jgi:hypothetical protein